jgi:hypothetical protein
LSSLVFILMLNFVRSCCTITYTLWNKCIYQIINANRLWKILYYFILCTLPLISMFIIIWQPRCEYLGLVHRNLSTRKSIFMLVWQTFLAKQNLVNSELISTLDKAIYLKGTFLQDSRKPLLTTQNRLETSWKKFAPFFNTSLLCSSKISMV